MPKIDFRNRHFLSLAGNIVLSFLGIGIVGLLYRFIPISSVGNWFYFLSIFSTLDAIRNGLLNTATVKFYGGTDKDRGDTVLGSVWFLAIAVTLAVLLLNVISLLFLQGVHHSGLAVTIKWLGITFLSSLPFSVTFWILTANEDFEKIIWLRLVNSGSMILSYSILIFLHQLTLETALLFNFLTNCLTSLVAIVSRLSRIETLRKATKTSVAEIAHFGKYSMATSLSSTLLRNTDIFIIDSFLGAAALAVYNIPVRLMEIVEIPLRSFVTTGMNSMAIAFNQGNLFHVGFVLKKYAGMLTLAFVPAAIFVFLFADWAILILSGPKYLQTDAANIYRILMLFAIMAPVDRFNGITLDIMHKPNINFYKVLVMLASGILFDLMGIQIFHNLYGIAFGVFFMTLSGIIFGYWQLKKYLPYTFREILSTGFVETKMLVLKLIGRGS